MSDTHPYLDGPHPRAYAHRGWHLDDLSGMENSLSGFRRAVAEGYRYLETDVHATSDGVVVVHHDSTLDRTTDKTGPVGAQPWSAVGGALIGGREKITRLADLLEELPDAMVNIDVKADAAVEPVLAVLRRAGAMGRVCLASFSDTRLARLRRLGGPRLLTSMGPRSVGALWVSGRVPAAGLVVRGSLAQVPAARGRLRVVDGLFVRAAHRRGAEVHVWTVDDEAEMGRLLDLGVDGLVTDRPDVLRDVLRARRAWAGS
ncbi:glycerophosphodiester phosphodiesterase family protein [Umezawaea endophytica]|uniref:Glycerophosphodiester phosphodiesterase n=1 Tax=Umezawaea endophytica TaxID=1654476 RepID=A0A9X3AGG7_9PSEU|nr:glycerophosphodiester phosphodiesterase family protein [Umezawaea endophytica]MCS7479626.1 glycerophosphodiester phosphodiesterase [Umezawaea endophytica]